MPPEPASQRPYFDTPARTERLQLLLHLIRNAGPTLYLRGAAGSGKRRFTERLIEELDDEFESIVIDAAAHTDLAAALRALAADPAAAPARVIEDLVARDLLLAIDRAERLDATASGVLSAWRSAGGRLLLIGPGAPRSLVQALEIQFVDLPAFSAEESAAFLRQQAGAAAGRVTDDVASAVHRAADGQPGAMLQALDAMLADTPAARAPARRAPKPVAADQPVAAASPRRGGLYSVVAGLALALAAAVLIYQDEINGLFETPATQTALDRPPARSDHTDAEPARRADSAPGVSALPAGSAVEHRRPSLPAPVSPPESPLADTSADTSAADTAGAADVRSAPPGPPAGETPGPGEAIATPAPVAPDPLDAVMADALAAERAGEASVAAEATPPPAAAAKPAQAGDGPVAAADAPAATPGLPVAGAAPVEERAPQPAAVEEPPRRDETIVAPASPVAVEPAAPAPVQTPGAAWLDSRDPKRYTLQLVGGRERAAVEKFVREHRVPRPYAIFARELKGRPWYSLVAGDFADRDAAVAARARLPASLRARDAWPRTFGSIGKGD